MAENVFPMGKVSRGQQLFFINSTQIPGIQSISSSFDNKAVLLDYIGIGKSNFAQNGPYNGNFTINSLLVSTDQFLQYTGNLGFNGYIVESKSNTNKSYSFTSGYLTTYTQRCAIGEIPQITTSIDVFGNLGRLPLSSDVISSISNSVSTLQLQVPGPGCISLSFPEFNTNALQSYELTLNIPRVPIYMLGNQSPTEINIKYPVQVNLSFDILQNDFAPIILYAFPFTPTYQNLTLTTKDYYTNNTINTYSFNNMLFLGQTYGTDVNRNNIISLKYGTFYTR